MGDKAIFVAFIEEELNNLKEIVDKYQKEIKEKDEKIKNKTKEISFHHNCP